MNPPKLRIAIAGCGNAARIHLDRLPARDEVSVVACADPDVDAARELAARATERVKSLTVAAFSDHREMLHSLEPDALAVFTPHLSHYRLAMDALQAGCHVFIEKPLSTNVQEAADIVGLARGRNRKVGVGHQFRLCPSLIEVRRRLATGVIGQVRLVTAVLSRPWLATLGQEESTWRFDPKVAGGGILADAGDHLIDTLIWTTGQPAREVGAIQSEWDPGIDLVTAAAVRLADGTPVALAISGISPRSLFSIEYLGELGRLIVTDTTLEEERLDTPRHSVVLPESRETIDGNFVAALTRDEPLCCPADQAMDTVRLLEAISRSASTGQIVRIL